MKFYLLRVDPKKKMIFNPEESIDFHGFTGPFIQYTYARIKSILRKEMFYLDYTGPACVGKSINEALGNNIEKDYELGNNNGLLILKHDPSRKIIYDDKIILHQD
jgi:hypothetical protein